MFEQNNESIALDIIFVPHNGKKITFACKSEYNSERKNKVVLLTINDDAKKCIILQ